MRPVWIVDEVFRIGCPSESVLALVSGLPSHERTTHRMAAIQAQAYADDSGKEPPVYVFAGFVSSSAAWALFSDEWQDALDNARPHRIPYIKMRDAYALKNHFLGFSESERDNLLRSLWMIIKEHAQYGVAVRIDARRYSAEFKGKIAQTLDSPYFVLNNEFVMSVIKAEREQGLSRTVDFIFDNQGSEERDVDVFWNYRKSMAPRWLRKRFGANPIWRSEQQFRPLQAADMLAWTARRIAVEGPSNIENMMESYLPELSMRIYTPYVDIERLGHGMVKLKTVKGQQYETARMRSDRRRGLTK